MGSWLVARSVSHDPQSPITNNPHPIRLHYPRLDGRGNRVEVAYKTGERVTVFREPSKELMATLKSQLPQARAASAGKVTCVCSRNVELLAAYRCLHCGVWFCRQCGVEHFGPDTTTEEAE